MPEAELLRSLIAFPLPIHPPSLRARANHNPLLSNLTNKLRCSPQTFAVHTDREKWLTHRFSLWMNHIEIQISARHTERKEKKCVWRRASHQKLCIYLFTVCAICSVCMFLLFLFGFQCLASLTVIWLSAEFGLTKKNSNLTTIKTNLSQTPVSHNFCLYIFTHYQNKSLKVSHMIAIT